MSRDSVVDEDFKVAFIRMADDFDLMLKEKFLFEPKELPWKTFTIVKQAQGEVFFRPRILHTYDNYFQLLRSLYERSADGYFWIDFNRYDFTFDPNRPEQVSVAFELGLADLVAKEGSVFQRKESGVYDDHQMSQIPYPTTIIEKHGTIDMAGADGLAIESAEVTARVLIDADSLRFVSLFLPSLLKEDSIYVNGQPVDYYHRKDFDFIGIILPSYYHRGDTLDFTLWCKGTNFDRFLPYVENPQGCPHSFTFTVPKGFNYYMPGMSAMEPANDGSQRFTVSSPNPYNEFYFHGYASIDTISVTSESGILLNFLKEKHVPKRLLDCFTPDDKFKSSIVDAFNYLSSHFGAPPTTFVEYIVPEHSSSMPGLIEVLQTACVTEGPAGVAGGFDAFGGAAVAKQWFGSLLRPVSDRERWIVDAPPYYLSLMYVQDKLGETYYTNLLTRRDSIYTIVERKRDMPLATGRRASSTIRINKGIWLLHMLKMLMYDLESHSSASFLRFLQELTLTFNTSTFTNKDFIELAEKHYGQSLDWFFKQWLYGRNFPEFDVKYKINERGSEYFVNATVKTKGVAPDFTMPVAMRVVHGSNESTFLRQTVGGPETTFELGPFPSKPEKLVFNEFFSVLSKDKVKRK
jgi:hypothetical protein